MSNYHPFITSRVQVWKADLSAIFHYRLLRLLIIVIFFLFILQQLQVVGIISDPIFQSLCTAIIVLSVITGRDWQKNARHYRNMAIVIALELSRNYLELHIARSALVNYQVNFKTDNWTTLQYELAKYMPASEYQSLYYLYAEMLPELQDTRNLLNYNSRLDMAISTLEQLYTFLESELRGHNLPPLKRSLHIINQHKLAH
ncbi:hypothetical protein SPTER_17280 [Sporomusa termitida]|uniref:Uncharacterized protein n=2 Tax=Sporomusa termitida TaxID=2377 RepID=A0A517DSS4_9FIRM|nr:hypothetical protein SPTER_17280 [Sporomusa termitida]